MKIENINLAGMRGYVQCAEACRWSPPDVGGWMTSTVKAGDRWQPGGVTSDDRKHSERTEFRSLDEDVVGDGNAYVYGCDLLIPSDYAEMSPKATLMQWHEGGYPIAFVRYEMGVLEFILNYQSTLNLRRQIPFKKGTPVELNFVFVWTPGENAGSVLVVANGVTVVAERGISIVEKAAKTVYAKAGIYRSGMDRYTGPKPAPSQTVRHQNLGRHVCAIEDVPWMMINKMPTPVTLTPSAPISATPVPTPAPSPASGLVAARLANIRTELEFLGRDISPPSAAALVSQAAEKLYKASSQISKSARKSV